MGDATVPADVQRLMGPDAADCVFSDPPYNIDYQGYTKERLTIQNDQMSSEQFKHFLHESFKSFRSAVNPTRPCTSAIPPRGSGSFRMLWNLPASKSVVRSSGQEHVHLGLRPL